jgi:catechol 2,3-dioxygenase-like lactoylglutathione lyase family enzyme
MSAGSQRGSTSEPSLYLFATTIVVSDRKRAVEWYTSKLGLEVIQDMGHWVTVGHRGANGLIHLCQGPDVEEELSPGNQGIIFHVRGDFEKKVAELARERGKLDAPVTRKPWGLLARIGTGT